MFAKKPEETGKIAKIIPWQKKREKNDKATKFDKVKSFFIAARLCSIDDVFLKKANILT